MNDLSVFLYPEPALEALDPLTEAAPIALLPVLGRPVVHWNLEALARAGVRNVHFSLWDRPEQVENYVKHFGTPLPQLEFHLQRKPLSPVGSLWRIRELVQATTLAMPQSVLHTLDVDSLQNDHRARGAGITVIAGAGECCAFLIEKSVLMQLKPGKMDSPEQLFALAREAGIKVEQYGGAIRWRPLHTLEGWRLANEQECEVRGVEIDPTAHVPESVRKSIKGPCVIGARTRIGEGVRIEGPAVIGDDVRIGAGTLVQRSLVLNRTWVGEKLDLVDAAAAGPILIDFTVPSGVWIDDEKVLTMRRPTRTDVKVAQWLFDFGSRALVTLGLLCISPILLTVALAIKITSPGPVFYVSKRTVSPTMVESRERFYRKRPAREVTFRVFRTMVPNADKMKHVLQNQNIYASGPYHKVENDPRVTRIGHFLRKTSLDELPLLLSVVTGDLKLVGLWALPRYEAEGIAKGELDEKVDLTETSALRFEGAPGIAGLWQSRGRSNLSAEERAIHDSYQALFVSRGAQDLDAGLYSVDSTTGYQHLLNQLRIVMETVNAVLLRRGAK